MSHGFQISAFQANAFQAEEAISEQAPWFTPLSEPVRFRIDKRLAISLIASGLTAVTLDSNQLIIGFESPWHYAWSEPVKFKINHGLAVALDASGPFQPILGYLDLIRGFESPWHQPWSEPIRLSYMTSIRTAAQQGIATYVRLIPTISIFADMDAGDTHTDVALIAVDVYTVEPTVPDLTGAKVSIEEVSVSIGGPVSIRED